MVKWAKHLNVSASGYHSWKKNKPEREAKKRQHKAEIKEIFKESRQTYGAEKISAIIRANGGKASRPVVQRYMNEMGLESMHRKTRSKSLTDSRKARGEGYPNLTKGLDIMKRLQVLSGDITYIRAEAGFEYLATVRDVFTGEVLGYHSSDRMTKELVIKAFLNAEAKHKLPAGIIFHSDRGSQYTSEAYQELLKTYKVKQSFSRVGTPGDNAWSESFFGIFKKECVALHTPRPRKEIRMIIFDYIEYFYNRIRVQKRLGYMSPVQFTKMLMEEQKLVA